MIITTLPIAYKKNRPVRILFTSFIASLIAKNLGSKTLFPLNISSLRERVDVDPNIRYQEYEKALNLLNLIGPEDCIILDINTDLIKFSLKLVDFAINEGICSYQDTDISFCNCGAVEIQTELLNNLTKNGGAKIVNKTGSCFECSKCNSILRSTRQPILVHHLGFFQKPKIIPSIYGKTILDLQNRLQGKSIMISRTHRNMHNGIKLGDNLYLDPDYHMALYLKYIKDSICDNEIVLVVGINNAFQACRSLQIINDLDPEIKISLVVHPMIRFNKDSIFNPKTSPEEFLKLTHNPLVAKFFLTSMLQWSNVESRFIIEDIDLIEKSLIGKNIELSNFQTTNLENIPSLINRNSCFNLLKKIRQKKRLNHDESLFFSSLQ